MIIGGPGRLLAKVPHIYHEVHMTDISKSKHLVEEDDFSITFGIRDWLNPIASDDTGNVGSSYGIPKGEPRPFHNSEGELRPQNKVWGPAYESRLEISDCNKKVTLELGVYCETLSPENNIKLIERIQNRKAKLQILRKHLDFLEGGLLEYERAIISFHKKAEELYEQSES